MKLTTNLHLLQEFKKAWSSTFASPHVLKKFSEIKLLSTWRRRRNVQLIARKQI